MVKTVGGGDCGHAGRFHIRFSWLNQWIFASFGSVVVELSLQQLVFVGGAFFQVNLACLACGSRALLLFWLT